MSAIVSSSSFIEDSVNAATIRRGRRRRSPTSFRKDQLEVLETEFVSNHYPNIYARERLATSLQLPESRIQVCSKSVLMIFTSAPHQSCHRKDFNILE